MAIVEDEPMEVQCANVQHSLTITRGTYPSHALCALVGASHLFDQLIPTRMGNSVHFLIGDAVAEMQRSHVPLMPLKHVPFIRNEFTLTPFD